MSKIEVDFHFTYHFCEKCEPEASLGFHLSRDSQYSDTDVVYINQLKEKQSITFTTQKNGDIAIFVSLFALVSSSSGGVVQVARKRIDQCIIDSSNVDQEIVSTYGKFKVRVNTKTSLAKGCQKSKELIKKRAENSWKAFISCRDRWKFEFGRVCEMALMDQPETLCGGEYYWFYQAQHKRVLSENMFLAHLKLAMFILNFSEDQKLDLNQKLELMKELLSIVAHQISYMPDELDECVSEVKNLEDRVLKSQSTTTEDLIDKMKDSCKYKKLIDIASCPLDIENHSFFCGDCEDLQTVTINQARNFSNRKFENNLLTELSTLAGRYYFCSASTFVYARGSGSSARMMQQNIPKYKGEYHYSDGDLKTFEDQLTPHTTTIAMDKNLVLSAVSGTKYTGECLPTILLESCEWSPCFSSDVKDKTETDTFYKKFKSFEFNSLFRHLETVFESRNWRWYFFLSAVYCEDIRRVIGKGELVPLNAETNEFGLLFPEMFDTQAWQNQQKYRLVPRLNTSKEEDKHFAHAMQRVSRSEGCTFLPRETDFSVVAVSRNSERIALLTISERNWNRTNLQEGFASWLKQNKLKYSEKSWVVSKDVVCITLEIISV